MNLVALVSTTPPFANEFERGSGAAGTGTDVAGNRGTFTCSDWSANSVNGTAGYAHDASRWTHDSDESCSSTAHLDCFEQ